MKSHKDIALLELRKEKDHLLLRLGEVNQAIAVLEKTSVLFPPVRPLHRADLLREYLTRHPEGVPVKGVPAVLAAMGHVSRAAHPATNWLYQLPPEKDFFLIHDGLVTLRLPNAAPGGRANPAAGKGPGPSSQPSGGDVTSR